MSQIAVSSSGGGGGGSLSTLTGNTGGAISPSAGNINIVGAGSVTVTGSGNTLTISDSGSSSAVVNVTSGTQSMSVDTQYIANNLSGQVVFTLPAIAALGSKVSVQGSAAGGWRISQNAGQTINFGDVPTTTGTSGYLEFSNRYDTIELMCIVANTTWASTGKAQGLNITVA